MRTALAIAVIAVVASAALGAGHDYDRDLRGSVKIDGSSTVYPITEAVAEEFAKVCPRVRVTVGISGTGGGMKRFTVGETDISDASRPIKEKERKIAAENGIEFIEIPVAYDGISIVVNKSNTWVDQLSVDDLRKIFLDGSPVTTWRDVRADWPNVPISIYAPGTDSGTFDYFKDVVAGKTGAIRSDMSVSEDDNVLVRGVAGDRGGIGFFGCAYYFENKDKLRAIPIVNPETRRAVAPTPETIENGRYAPFSRPLFIYVSRKSAERPEVQALVKFYFEYGPELAEEVGYVRLPEIISLRAMVNFNDRMTGTQFLTMDGEKIHGPLLKIYRKLPVSVALGQ
ncbi:MAG: PstS family phosphate ABC transporter substrate-binding protein [Phycisphaerales bacterium]|nr:PstS family phosphate ABC transporter substrate-binding protein [Phycisphaerales bacterium]